MQTVRSILTLILLAGALGAQTASIKQAQQLATEQYLRTRDYSNPQEQQKRSQEEWLRSDFVRKANNFARLWARFAAQSNEKNSFDVDLAKKLDKAFSELRKTEGWPAK
jgi:DMSO/TMAO reductase YedYZ molybdopterin-dependent catalytic subunit